MRVTFESVIVKGTRRWIDPKTGKKRQQTRTFMQTISPWNIRKDGTPRSREEIRAELIALRDAWLAAPSGEKT